MNAAHPTNTLVSDTGCGGFPYRDAAADGLLSYKSIPFLEQLYICHRGDCK